MKDEECKVCRLLRRFVDAGMKNFDCKIILQDGVIVKLTFKVNDKDQEITL